MEELTNKVTLCEDGKYRWVYPYSLLTNPTVYFTLCKIFGGIALVGIILGYGADILRGDFSLILNDIKWWGLAVAVFLVISMLAYLIVAAMYRGKYVVEFTMDENGILHDMVPAQKKKVEVLGAVVAGTGALTGNIARTGQGVAIASHTSMQSDFSNVRSVESLRRWNTIKVNEPFAKNQIYVTKEDFDFVLDYIREHCPKIKK